MSEEIKMVGTKELATRLKLDPKELRALLRKISGKAPGVRYEWKESDPFLKKLPVLIADRKLREQKIVKSEPVKKAKKEGGKK
jgi:hypothetical protein